MIHEDTYRLRAAFRRIGRVWLDVGYDLIQARCRTVDEALAFLALRGFDTDDLATVPLAFAGWVLTVDDIYSRDLRADLHHTWHRDPIAAALYIRSHCDHLSLLAERALGPGADENDLEEWYETKVGSR